MLRAQLNKKPPFEFLLADASSALGQVFLEQARSKQTPSIRVSAQNGRPFEHSDRSRTQREWAEDLLREIEGHDWPVWVVSFHKVNPHLIWVSGLPERDSDTLSQMFALIRSMYRARPGGLPVDQEDEPKSLEDSQGRFPYLPSLLKPQTSLLQKQSFHRRDAESAEIPRI